MQISLVNILIAFAGGLLSFLSPCVLPLVPGYISLMSGVSIDHLKAEGASGSRRAVIANSLAFNVGLSVIFLTLGGAAGRLVALCILLSGSGSAVPIDRAWHQSVSRLLFKVSSASP